MDATNSFPLVADAGGASTSPRLGARKSVEYCFMQGSRVWIFKTSTLQIGFSSNVARAQIASLGYVMRTCSG